MPAAGDLLARAARGFRAYVALALLTLAFALPGLFAIPPLDRDESRFAQATAQMLETGDFVRIRLQDEPRNKKPVGVYWLQAASVAAVSSPEAREIWAYRLPSALGALCAVLLTFWGGSALLGRRTAFVGAAFLAACTLLAAEASIAKTDAVLCGVSALAMAALARLYVGVGGRLSVLLFWAAVGLGVLVKGPVTPLVAGLAVVALCLFERRWTLAAALSDWRGPAVALAIVAPWAAAIVAATDGGFFVGLFNDLAPKISGGGEHSFLPPGVHLSLAPFLSFPGVLGLGGALVVAWRALRAAPSDPEHAPARFLLAWILPAWVVFEAAPTKLPHYTLPLYPALALLLGTGALAALRSPSARLRAAALFLLGGAALVAVGAFAATLMPGDAAADLRRSVQTALVLGGVLATATVAIAAFRRPEVAIGAALIAAFILVFTVKQRLLPEARTVLASHEAVLALRREGLAGAPVLAVGYREPSLVFELGTQTALRSAAEGGAMAVAGQPALVEARARVPFEAELAARALAFAPSGDPIVARNYSNGEDVSLQPGRVVSAARETPTVEGLAP